MRPISISPWALLSLTLASAQQPFVRVGDTPLDHVAVASLADGFPGSNGSSTLLLTTFYPTGDNDGIYAVPNLASLFGSSPQQPQLIKLADAEWPNMAELAPEGSVAGRRVVLTAEGFFVSGSKSTGTVRLIDVTNALNNASSVVVQKISTDKKSYFYHCARWVDVDGDGRLDIIAARAYKSMINPLEKPKGELVWIRQPEKPDGEWVTGVLGEGPDVAFELVDLDGDGKAEVVSAQYFTASQLSVWWCNASTWSACDVGSGSAAMQSAVIANEESTPFFNVQFVDLDGDGNKELLATTNTANGNGAVYVYQRTGASGGPGGFGEWKSFTVATGYKPKEAILPGRGSPGTAVAFRLDKSSTDPRLHVVVSADDGGFVDLLSPSGAQDNWAFQYNKTRVVTSSNTVGTPAVGDVNGDGVAELFVPLFAENKLAWFAVQS